VLTTDLLDQRERFVVLTRSDLRTAPLLTQVLDPCLQGGDLRSDASHVPLERTDAPALTVETPGGPIGQ